MTTRLSQFNNTTSQLGTGRTFTGAWERTLTGLEISTFINCSGLCLLTIEQSVDASNVRIPTTFNYVPTTDVTTFSVSVGLPFFRVKLYNGDIGPQAWLSLNTYVINTPPLQVNVDAGSVVVSGTVAVSSVAGVVDVSGSVVASNLITETLATRRVDFLVVGNWYRVATVGNTSGAAWNAIGAIVDGESIPAIGRLFKCLAVGSSVAGAGTCYDVEYNTNAITLTDPTTVRVRDTYGDPIITTAGNLMVGINNIYTANPLHTIVDSGTVGIDAGANGVSFNDSSTVTVTNITNALPAGTNAIGSVTIFNSSIINTYTYADISGAWVGSGVDLRAYSLADLYMLSAGSVTSTLGMTFIGQYSPDNIHWFDSGNTLQLTTANPQGIATGILTASPYIRLKADPANAPGDVATDVTLWIPAKAI